MRPPPVSTWAMAPSTCHGNPGQLAAATSNVTGWAPTDIPPPASLASAPRRPMSRTSGAAGGEGAPAVGAIGAAIRGTTARRVALGPVGPPSAADAATRTELAVVV